MAEPMTLAWYELFILVMQFVSAMLAVSYIAYYCKRTHPMRDYLRRVEQQESTLVEGTNEHEQRILYLMTRNGDVVDTRTSWERDRDDALAMLDREFHA